MDVKDRLCVTLASIFAFICPQIGQISVMSQIGCFVPADPGCAIGVVDKLFTILDGDSLHGPPTSSSFIKNIVSAKDALQSLTERSLILFDEFGVGTNSTDGISLLASLIEYVVEMESPPRCFFITHFHEIDQFLFSTSTNKDQKLSMIKRLTSEIWTEGLSCSQSPVLNDFYNFDNLIFLYK